MDEIITELSKGTPMAEICRREGMPDVSTVWRWEEADPEFSQRVARAREVGHDAIAAGTLEIADDGKNDWMERLDNKGQSIGWVLNGEHVQRSKLRIDTRLKLLACWNPRKYGQKVQAEVSGPDGGPIQGQVQVVPGLDPFEAYRLLKAGGKLERQD